MVQHNNELLDLHKDCTYVFNETLCKIADLSSYPKVSITDNTGNSMTVDACDIFHMELTDAYLDGISDRTTVSVTARKTWYFDDEIPIRLNRSGKGWYLLNTPFSDASQDAPLPITTVDELEHIRNTNRSDHNLIELYKRLKFISK